jgi:polyphosphate:AMP phosphotransferase
MFETAEIGAETDKATYKKEVPRLREALLKAQTELARSKISVVVLMGGVEGGGKSETVNLLLEWLDARGIEVHALGEPSDEERERPPYWRVWRLLPPTGRLCFFVGSWYTAPIIQHAFEELSDHEFDEAMDRIVTFERMITNESVLLVKFWLHLSKAEQKKRLSELEEDGKTSWRVTKQDWKFAKRYDVFRKVSEEALRKTDTAEAPWHLVEATCKRHRNLEVARTLLERLTAALERSREPRPKPVPDHPKIEKPNILTRLDLKTKLAEKEYDDKLPRHQGKIAILSRRLRQAGRSMLLVFEGPDAAGKGGAIRRITQSLDARAYRVISVAAPTEEERAHPYLWRFWRHLPRLGRVTIYDRSWYGRVLVERLEGFCTPAEWQRAYSEINDFESQLAESGTIIAKFWLAISPDEQLRRFKDRQETPYKQYKIGPEDWRNRSKWDAYEGAACEMIERTSTSHAPWVLVEANDKLHARVKVLKTVADLLEEALG